MTRRPETVNAPNASIISMPSVLTGKQGYMPVEYLILRHKDCMLLYEGAVQYDPLPRPCLLTHATTAARK